MRKYRKIDKPSKERTDMVARALLAEERVRALRLAITASESRIKGLLDKLGYEYIFQEPFFDEYFFLIADFYLPKKKLIIEVDGESHNNIAQKRKEAKRKKWLSKQGIYVLRIKNKATIGMTDKQLKNRIKRALNRKKKKKV